MHQGGDRRVSYRDAFGVFEQLLDRRQALGFLQQVMLADGFEEQQAGGVDDVGQGSPFEHVEGLFEHLPVRQVAPVEQRHVSQIIGPRVGLFEQFRLGWQQWSVGEAAGVDERFRRWIGQRK